MKPKKKHTTQKFLIIKNRVETFRDFTINLIYYIFKYYIDKESLSENEDIFNHFNWCFNKVCDEFKLEEIDFSDNDELRNYFYSYFYNQFYKTNEEVTIEYFITFWNTIFEVEKQEKKNIINILIELYNIFNKSIDNEKNILELV